MTREVRIAINAANLANELQSEFAHPERMNGLVWRFRTGYHTRLALLWHEAESIPGMRVDQLLPTSVRVLFVEGLEANPRAVYTLSELTRSNVELVVGEIVEKLRWLAQFSLPITGV